MSCCVESSGLHFLELVLFWEGGSMVVYRLLPLFTSCEAIVGSLA